MPGTENRKADLRKEYPAMNNLIRLTDYSAAWVKQLFALTDELIQGKHTQALRGKSVVMFFPGSSIRTRVTFEKGIYLLGGQSIIFPPETLDKKEEIRDVCGYLNNWADLVIVRHKDMGLLEEMTKFLKVPLINAMTEENHPCEILTDLYALSRMRTDITKDRFLYVGHNGNIGRTWKEAAQVMGFNLEQCCGEGYEIEGLKCYHDIRDAVFEKDIVCTDSLPAAALADFRKCQVTLEAMQMANDFAVLNPCPPFYRGEEVSADVIDSEYFVGYEFKKHLLEVQQAIMIKMLQG